MTSETTKSLSPILKEQYKIARSSKSQVIGRMMKGGTAQGRSVSLKSRSNARRGY